MAGSTDFDFQNFLHTCLLGMKKKQQGINERVLHELVCLGRCIPMTKNSVIDGFKMYVSTM